MRKRAKNNNWPGDILRPERRTEKRTGRITAFTKPEQIIHTQRHISNIQLPLDLIWVKYELFENSTSVVYRFETAQSEVRTGDGTEIPQCPTCGEVCYSKGRRASRRRKNSPFAASYYAELEGVEICTYEGCGLIASSYADLVKRREYHFSEEENAYNNNIVGGKVDRRASYGFGVPIVDRRLRVNKALFGQMGRKLKFIICNYTRGKYLWRQVIAHIDAWDLNTSRFPNERWRIATDCRYNELHGPICPIDINAQMALLRKHQRMALRVGNGGIYLICGYCAKEYNSENASRRKLAK